MNYDLLSVLTFKGLVDLIFLATRNIVFCSLNLHQELAVPFSESSKKGVKVSIIIDPSESNYRNGFGDYMSVETLKKNGVNLYEIKGNQVSFLICDDIGYFLFPQSKIFSSDPEGPNAVLMDDITRIRILTHFFPPEDEVSAAEINCDLIDALKKTEVFIDNLQRNISSLKPEPSLQKLDEQKFEILVESLKNNPPLSPDLKRKMNVYTAKVKFVELKFIGAHINVAKVNIPPKALPFQNTALQKLIQSRLKLFSDIEQNPDLKEIHHISKEVESLRSRKKKASASSIVTALQYSLFDNLDSVTNDKKSAASYLIPITCRDNKSIIKVSDKKAFEEALGILREKISALKQKASDSIQKDILDAKDALKNELYKFMKSNPKEEYKNLTEEIRNKTISEDVNKIISQIKFPNSWELLDKLELRHHYYDLTIEDFRDKELLEEFRKREILTSDELDEIVESVIIIV